MIAHSYGSFVALKLAELLEKRGKSGRITFIDGAPAMLKTVASETYKAQTEEEIQNAVLAFSFTVLFKTIDETFVKECLCQPTWKEKVEKATSHQEAQKAYNKDYLELMLNAIVKRVQIMLSSDIKLCSAERTQATLIRPTKATLSNATECYDLDVNFKDKVDVKYLEGDHFSVLENPEMIATLNNLHSLLEQ